MTTKAYQSKRPLSRKIKEQAKIYAPKAKSAFLAGARLGLSALRKAVNKPKKRKRTTHRHTKKRR